VGTIFTLTTPCTVWPDSWDTSPEFFPEPGMLSHSFVEDQLRRFDSPGEQEVDETLQRLGTPMDMRLRELENELAKLNSSLDQLEKVLTR